MKISGGRCAIFVGALLLLAVVVAPFVSRPPSSEALSALAPRGNASDADMEKATRRQPDGRPGADASAAVDPAQGSAAGLNAAAGGAANPAAEGPGEPGKRAQASPKPALPLPAQVSPSMVASAFGDMASRAQEATAKLNEFARADPERFTDVRLMYASAAEALIPIAFAQALQDPVLRPLFLEKLKDKKSFDAIRESFAEGPEGGYLNFASAKSPQELMSLIQRVEPEYSRRFGEIVKSGKFPEEVQRYLADSIGAGYLKLQVGEYMRKYGYEFNPAQQSFEPSSSDGKPDLHQGTYFRLPWRQ